MNQTYASSGKRFLASLIDGFILGAIMMAIFIPIGIVAAMLGGGSHLQADSFDQSASNIGSVMPVLLLQLVGQLLSFGLMIWYFIFFQAKTGQTLGKKAMGIKVVTLDGQVPSKGKLFLRELVGKWVSSIILYIGFLMVLWDEKKQALHDKIAGTYVVMVDGGIPAAAAPVQIAPEVPAPSASQPTVQ